MDGRGKRQERFDLYHGEQTVRILRKDTRGFSLVELLAYLALLGMLLTVIYSIYYQFSRTLSAADRTMLKERSGSNAVRMLQDDIRRSSEVMDAFGPFRASDGTLILLIEQAEDSEKDIVIYRLAESESALIRHEAKSGRPSQGMSSRNIGFDIKEFYFSIDEENAKLLKVSILVKEGPLGILRNRPLTFHTLMRNG